jgi:hypothetical protein
LTQQAHQRAAQENKMKPRSSYANTGEVSIADAAILGSPTGREEGLAEDETLSDFEAEVQSHAVGARPRSEITGRHGSGQDDETVDGLNKVEEAVRREAEERPLGGRHEHTRDTT